MASNAIEWNGGNSWVGARLEVDSTANQAGNYSTVNARLYGRRNDGGTSYNYNGANFWINLDGTQTARTSGGSVSGTGWTLLHSASKTVYHNADGSRQIYISGGGNFPGTSYDMGSNGFTFTLDKITRQWTVSYNANGGTGAPGNQTKTYGYILTLSSQIPTREGYNFLGWSTSPNGGVQYSPGGQFGTDANTTLYAVWERIVLAVKLNAEANGGTVGGESYKVMQVYYGNRLGALEDAIKPNNEFLGWFTQQNEGKQYFGTEIIKSSIDLYAHFKMLANCYMRKDGVYVPSMLYKKESGKYKTGELRAKQSGEYRKQSMD